MQFHKHRFYIDAQLETGTTLNCPTELSHYLCRVLRLPESAEIRLFDGRGSEVSAVITKPDRKAATVMVTETMAPQPSSTLSITLVQAVTRAERLDYSIQKATELGVDRIQLLNTARCQVSFRDDKLGRKMTHWNRTIISACEQSGRTRLPVLHAPIDLADYLATDSDADRILCCPEATTPLSELEIKPSVVEFLIGPEGGLEQSEIDAATASGMHRVLMGPRILRTETAGPVAITACQLMWGDM